MVVNAQATVLTSHAPLGHLTGLIMGLVAGVAKKFAAVLRTRNVNFHIILETLI